MADHARKQIRDAVKVLLTDLETTEGRVFANRVRDMQKKDCPGLVIYAKEEESDHAAINSKLSRQLDLAVEGYVHTSETVDDDLDKIASEVEVAIASDSTLGGLAKEVLITSSELFIDGEGSKKLGVIRMIFEVGYWTTKADPTTAL